jgi:hypothetical protein
LSCIGLLLLHELVHGNGDVAPQTDRVGTSSVIQTLSQPQGEEVPNVDGVEDIVIEEEGVSHAQTHGGIVRPHPHFPVPASFDVLKALLDDPQAFLFEVLELS